MDNKKLLEQIGELIDIKLRPMQEQIGSLDSKFDSLDEKFTSLDSKVTSLDSKVTSLDTRFTSLESKVDIIDTKLNSLDLRVDAMHHELKNDILDLQDRQKEMMDILVESNETNGKDLKRLDIRVSVLEKHLQAKN